MPANPPAPLDCECAGAHFEPFFHYDAPPAGEVRFLPDTATYRRDVLRCRLCGHFLSCHSMDTADLYSGKYVDATYGDAAGLRRNFERIIALPAAKSDNSGRAKCIVSFASAYFKPDSAAPSILDVGSGLCVFLYRMKEAGWRCTALDPDARAAAHAREVVGVDAVCGDFMNASGIKTYDVITFNKVLEHVENPVPMLARARDLLNPDGFVYIELPDGEAAGREGPGREEFFVDHIHVFSATSLANLVERAGFDLLHLERLREPSTKFTLRAFARLAKT